ncbi:MAG: conjugal transfer protein TraH, partial [Alphaproteobacteria bacterium]|nr:conjugal transfer protein TraH [Alphaproteobacteria bacterium]
MKGIISGAGSYAFMLAVETYAPQVHGIMQQLNKLAADFNSMNINSCEVAAGLVGSVWPKSNAKENAVCKMLATHEGGVSDLAKARQECGQDTTIGTKHAKEEQFIGAFNLSWRVLKKMRFNLKGDATTLNPLDDMGGLDNTDQEQLKEIFMTFSGTIIKKEDGKKVILPAQGDRETFLKTLMSGGGLTYYKCDEMEKCLNPTQKTINLPADSALHRKITTILESMSDKIQRDEGNEVSSPAEISLINATSLPLYKFINVSTAYQKGKSPISLAEYGEIIAFDVVVTYVNDVLMSLREIIANMRDVQFSDEDLGPFLKGLRETQGSLMGLRQNVFQKMNQMLDFIQKTQMIEAQLHHMMGSLPEM